jgi:hypothetical protein
MFICKHCKAEFDGFTRSQKANHSRWCHANPKRSSYGNGGRQLHTEQAVANRIKGIKKAHADGKYSGSAKKSVETRKLNGKLNHTDETKELIRQKALSSKHRRLVRSIREYVRRDGSTVMLDSSWEEALAKRLDETGVLWVRPEDPIEYIGLDGRMHNYFPDFYLPEHNLYLDPKNPAAINAQKHKLNILSKVMNNLIIIKTLDACKNYKV